MQHVHKQSASGLGQRCIEHQAVLLPTHQRVARDGIELAIAPPLSPVPAPQGCRAHRVRNTAA
jgi:hypothetical protein